MFICVHHHSKGVLEDPLFSHTTLQDKSPAAVKDVILSSAVTGSEDAKKRVLLQLVVEPRCCQRLMS